MKHRLVGSKTAIGQPIVQLKITGLIIPAEKPSDQFWARSDNFFFQIVLFLWDTAVYSIPTTLPKTLHQSENTFMIQIFKYFCITKPTLGQWRNQKKVFWLTSSFKFVQISFLTNILYVLVEVVVFLLCTELCFDNENDLFL